MLFPINPPWGWNVPGAERSLRSWCHIGWRNTKICIHRASRMEQKRGKCWKLPIFEGKLRVFISYLSEMKIVCSITLLYSSTFYSLFLPFFVLEIFKFKYDKVFVRNSASICKFEWFEQLCVVMSISHPDDGNAKKESIKFRYRWKFRKSSCYKRQILVLFPNSATLISG